MKTGKCVVVCVFAFLALILWTAIVSSIAKYGVTGDCQMLGKFSYGSEVYECRKVP